VLSYPSCRPSSATWTSSSSFSPWPPSSSPRERTVTISRDRDDDRLIDAALAAHANFIVSGDQDLLTLGHIRQIEVNTPREFLETLHPGA
jgi:predicted nucleic acid-binding protein